MKQSTLQLLSLLPVLFLSASAEDVNLLFTGQAHISVLNYTTFERTTPNDRIGCLNARGALTLNDCAVFTRPEFGPPLYIQQIISPRGPCSFNDKTAVANEKSVADKNSRALSCTEEFQEEHFYTINGFDYPFLCERNIACIHETTRAPATTSDELPIWENFWVERVQVTPGNLMVLLLWEPIGNKTSTEGK